MNMKKLVALLLALVMVFALCACGPKDNQDIGWQRSRRNPRRTTAKRRP